MAVTMYYRGVKHVCVAEYKNGKRFNKVFVRGNMYQYNEPILLLDLSTVKMVSEDGKTIYKFKEV